MEITLIFGTWSLKQASLFGLKTCNKYWIGECRNLLYCTYSWSVSEIRSKHLVISNFLNSGHIFQRFCNPVFSFIGTVNEVISYHRCNITTNVSLQRIQPVYVFISFKWTDAFGWDRMFRQTLTTCQQPGLKQLFAFLWQQSGTLIKTQALDIVIVFFIIRLDCIWHAFYLMLYRALFSPVFVCRQSHIRKDLELYNMLCVKTPLSSTL